MRRKKEQNVYLDRPAEFGAAFQVVFTYCLLYVTAPVFLAFMMYLIFGADSLDGVLPLGIWMACAAAVTFYCVRNGVYISMLMTMRTIVDEHGVTRKTKGVFVRSEPWDRIVQCGVVTIKWKASNVYYAFFSPYRLTDDLLRHAKSPADFVHCGVAIAAIDLDRDMELLHEICEKHGKTLENYGKKRWEN